MHDLASELIDARERTIQLVADLGDGALVGPRLTIVNPLLWEAGHVAWFQERWVLRHAAGLPPALPEVDALYDSSAIPHDVRWDLPLLSRRATLDYLREVHERVLGRLRGRTPPPEEEYFLRLSLFHEDMHGEAFLYTRQTLGLPPPCFSEPVQVESRRARSAPIAAGDAHVPGGTFLLGSSRDEAFVFDNEKWAHAVEVRPFAIARSAVTQGEFAEFVDSGGYARAELWSEAGGRWRAAERVDRPLYWRREGRTWMRRHFDAWVPLEPERAMVHVGWYEAEAYCRWAGRRLPTEVEWEVAASARPDGAAGYAPEKRRFPWGGAAPTAEHANLDALRSGCVAADALPAGDSAFGCRQMIGNVWEWTASDFLPYPGFVADPYEDYSQPWFGTHKVLRGGCFATRARLLRNTLRNFYLPERRDVWAGFRTCAP
jgi:iron(II)-dependent oxidoreductase